jgi:hypothetical protein
LVVEVMEAAAVARRQLPVGVGFRRIRAAPQTGGRRAPRASLRHSRAAMVFAN